MLDILRQIDTQNRFYIKVIGSDGKVRILLLAQKNISYPYRPLLANKGRPIKGLPN